MRTRARLRLACVNLLVFVALFALLEIGVRVQDHRHAPAPIAQTYGVPAQPLYHAGDALLGYRGQPRGGRYRAVRAVGADTTYDVVYTLDPGGWRHVPQAAPDSATRFVAFFGCSFTFGEGVGDSATLPAAFARLAPRERIYDRGFHGWGPQSMLALMEAPPAKLAVPQKAGIAVFTTIDGHLERLRGDYFVASAWGSHMPLYERGIDGMPQRHGDFTTGRPLRQAMYRIAAHSHVLTHLATRLTRAPSPEDWSFLADVFQRSCALFAQRYDSRGCYVVIWPTMSDTHEHLAPLLRARGVHVLDYTSLWTPADSTRYQIPGDRHPTPAAYHTVAMQLASDLGDDWGR